MSDVEHFLHVGNTIGEGPIWDARDQSLYWVNFIGKSEIWQFSPETGQLRVFETAVPVMALGLRRAGGFIAAATGGISVWTPESNRIKPFCNPIAGCSSVRFNDGGTDPGGRFWIGTMNNVEPGKPDGELFCIQDATSVRREENGIATSNGVGWSPDRKSMYLTDTFRRTISVYDFDMSSGHIRNRRLFAEIPEAVGFPDGLAVDQDGFVWSAIWGGFRVLRFDPRGEVERELRVPAPNPTSCCFGGPGLRHLYITTARLGISEEELSKFPLSGDLFRYEGDMCGLPEPEFTGQA